MNKHSNLIVVAISIVLAISATAQNRPQQRFSSPQEAGSTLLQSLKANDLDRLLAIFGPNASQVLSSGDPVQDKHDREILKVAMEQSWRWSPRGKAQELIVGHENWPFPIPLVRSKNSWWFDTKAGEKEVLARRIGRNELAVIRVCQSYILIQKAYASEPRDGKRSGVYAQKVRSDAGRQNGLYWEVKPGEKLSPLGDLAAQAEARGYDREKKEGSPFLGYYFRILTAQGPAARGGAKSYIVNGDMSQGFALVAYPASYRNSGVMTFIVDQNGVVYQKDLGPETATLASGMKEFNPDRSWFPLRRAP